MVGINARLHLFGLPFISISTLVLGLFTGVMSARMLGPQGRGELTILFYLPNLLGSIVAVSMPQAVAYILSKDDRQSSHRISAALWLGLLTGVLGALVLYMAAPLLISNESIGVLSNARLMLVFAPALVIFPILCSIQISIGNVYWSYISRFINAAFYMCALVILAIYIKEPTSTIVAVCSFLALVIVIIVHIALLLKKTAIFPRFEEIKSISKLSLLYFAPGTMLLVFDYIDRAVLMKTVSVEALGIYAITYAVSSPLTTLVDPLAQVGFVELAATKSTNKAIRLLKQRFRLVQLTLGILVVFEIALMPAIIPLVFGSDYRSAIIPGILMVIGMSANAATKTLQGYLRVFNKMRICTYSYLVTIAIYIILSLYMIDAYGLIGFVTAYLISTWLNLFLHLLIIKYTLSIPLNEVIFIHSPREIKRIFDLYKRYYEKKKV